jgi:hypothetical protein
MKQLEYVMTRGQWRVWLRGVIVSGLLDRLPPSYDPEGAVHPGSTAEAAQNLLAALRDPSLSRQALAHLMSELALFRQWVEARQKLSRQVILAERETAQANPHWLEQWAASTINQHHREPARNTNARAIPGGHPLWDDQLDTEPPSRD